MLGGIEKKVGREKRSRWWEERGKGEGSYVPSGGYLDSLLGRWGRDVRGLGGIQHL